MPIATHDSQKPAIEGIAEIKQHVQAEGGDLPSRAADEWLFDQRRYPVALNCIKSKPCRPPSTVDETSWVR
jgi:hypothetical protein